MRGEQELDLFQFSTRQVAEPGARSAQIMRGKVLDASPLGVGGAFHHMPDCLRRDRSAPRSVHPVYSSENRAGVDVGGYSPCVIWKSSALSATNSARRKPHPISTARIALSRLTLSASAGDCWSNALACSMVNQFPILYAQPLRTFHAMNTGRQFGTQEACVGGFEREPLHGGQPDI